MTNLTINIPFPILSEENYEDWYSQMKTFLQAQDLKEVVQEGFTMPENQAMHSATKKKLYRMINTKITLSYASITVQNEITKTIPQLNKMVSESNTSLEYLNETVNSTQEITMIEMK